MKKILSFILVIASLALLASKIDAQAVINEINPSGEWVELFKISQGALSMDGCVIYFQDTKSQKKILTPEDNFLESETFKVINTGGNYLNNTENDTVSLNCSDFNDGPITYADNMGTKSFVRVPNGTGSFITLEASTQGSANPDFTPSPTPTSTPTSSPTPSPTLTPAPTKTPTPNPTKTPSPMPAPTRTPTPTQEIILSSETANLQEDAVLGESVAVATSSPEESVLDSGENAKRKFPILGVGLIVLGLGFMGLSIFSIIKSAKKGYTGEGENENGQIS
jgi:hypothetical protein